MAGRPSCQSSHFGVDPPTASFLTWVSGAVLEGTDKEEKRLKVTLRPTTLPSFVPDVNLWLSGRLFHMQTE